MTMRAATDELGLGWAIELAGLVKDGIWGCDGQEYPFGVTDGPSDRAPSYAGLSPNLFRERRSGIAHSSIRREGGFTADNVLYRRDNNYVCKDVVDATKVGGKWWPETAGDI